MAAHDLCGRRRKRKAKPPKRCLACGTTMASWKWLCDPCFGALPFSRKKEICEARAARLPERTFGLSRDAAQFLVEKRQQQAEAG